ncbi:MAG: DUF58 domain-containing protein [Proteobacteria bacterium]|nr:DUF58 domain-containing protein [Pseudomonadota bacterium]
MDISREELNEVLKEVRQIEMRTGKVVSDVLAGEYQSVFKGRGMEFEDVREYFPGDDVRNIDWNVTARMNHPYVKNFKEERELTVMILVDVSASSGFGTIGFSKANIIAKICATLAFSAIHNHDKVELILFSDKVERFIPAKKGSKHVLRIIRELLVSAKILEKTQSKAATDINVALSHLNRKRKKRGVCFIVSDFISSDFQSDLRLAARRHDITAICVSDPREIEIPMVGLIELEDSETGEMMLVDTSSDEFQHRFRASVASENEGRKSFFKSLGIDLLEINTRVPFENALVNFFKARGKRR